MHGTPVSHKTLTQLHVSISVDVERALDRLERLIEPAPFTNPALFRLRSDLQEIQEAVNEAGRRDGQIATLLAGPWLCGEGSEL